MRSQVSSQYLRDGKRRKRACGNTDSALTGGAPRPPCFQADSEGRGGARGPLCQRAPLRSSKKPPRPLDVFVSFAVWDT